MTTKEKILNAALMLFNRDGIDHVTTRDIAAETVISQGNLHYHFSSKESLIKSLYMLFMQETKQAERFQGSPLSPADLLEAMQDSFRIMYNYRFLVFDREAVWHRIPEIKVAYLSAIEQKKEHIWSMIRDYRKSGILRTDLSDDQYLHLARQFIFLNSSWLHGMAYIESGEKPYVTFAGFTFKIWIPYLTTQGKTAWDAVIRSHL